MTIAVGVGKVKGGNSVRGRGVKRAELQRARRSSFLDTLDSSIQQRYRAAFCALKNTRSSHKPAIDMDSGL